jgi:sec-independent protein translocase protein TatB
MNVFGIGTGELLLILVIVLLVMGPERIPQLARQWGKFVRVLSRFTRTWQEINAEINRQINLEEMVNAPPKTKPSPPSAAAETGETTNTIAPPEKQPQASSLPAGEVPAPASDLPDKSVLSDASLTPPADAPTPTAEHSHE